MEGPLHSPDSSRDRFRRVLRFALHPAASWSYLALILLPLIIAGFYNHPSSDDFSNSAWTGFWAYQKHLYLNLTGRFFSSIVISLDPMHWHSIRGYQIEAMILIIVFACSYVATISALLQRFTKQPRKIRLFFSVIATAVMFNGAPSLAQGFYWLTGSMTYTLPVLLLCWVALIGIRLDRRPDELRPGLLFIQGILAAAATACNEVIIVVPGVLAAWLFIRYRREGKRKLARWYLLFLLIWLGVAITAVAAPGNFVRQSLQTRNTAALLPAWLDFSRAMFLEWLAEPGMLIFSLLYLALAHRYRSMPPLRAISAMLLSLAVVVVIFFPACWALGRMPPWRVRNVAYMLFIPAWICSLSAIAEGIRRFGLLRPELLPFLRGAFAAAAFFVVLSMCRMETVSASSNYWMLAKNFRKKTLVNYDAEQHARYALIRGSNSDTVVIPRLQFLENNMVFFSDLGPDPHKFPNVGAASLFGKRLLILAADSTAKK